MKKPIRARERHPGPDEVARWLRDRRQQMGFSTSELARRLDVSPAFVSLVESGKKLPGAESAIRWARALRVPEAALEAWLRIYYPENIRDSQQAHREILSHLRDALGSESPEPEEEEAERLLALRAFARPVTAAFETVVAASARGVSPSFLRRHPSSEEVASRSPEPSASYPLLPILYEAAQREGFEEFLLELHRANPDRFEQAVEQVTRGRWHFAARDTVAVHVIPEGADPNEALPYPAREPETLHLHASLLPGVSPSPAPFAYRLGERGAAYAPDALAPGDLVVLRRDRVAITPSSLYAVRVGPRVVLSRVAIKESSLLVVPSDPAVGVEVLPLEDPAKAPPQVRGRVALILRSPG